MCEELENEKNSKKIGILKTSLFLYMTVISKVVCEELEVLKDNNYLFLEYLNNIGFTYNLKEKYLKNMENLSNKIKIFEDTYKAIESRLNREELIEDAGAMEIDLKLDIFRGQCVKIAKNYLTEKELQRLNLLVSQFLDFAEFQALEERPMRMADWISALDNQIIALQRKLLEGKGSVSHQEAIEKAEREFNIYRQREMAQLESDFDKMVKRLPKGGQNPLLKE